MERTQNQLSDMDILTIVCGSQEPVVLAAADIAKGLELGNLGLVGVTVTPHENPEYLFENQLAFEPTEEGRSFVSKVRGEVDFQNKLDI